jgi:hypothetical protein
MAKKVLPVHLDETQRREVERLAGIANCSMAEIVRRSVKAFGKQLDAKIAAEASTATDLRPRTRQPAW